MSTAQNKELVKRYNKEVIENGNMNVLHELAIPGFINYSAPAGMDNGLAGMAYFFTNILHAAFSNISVAVHDMVAEGNKVVTRKTITGTHTGTLMELLPTGRAITLSVIDIITVEEGKLTSHWGENNFMAVVQSLS
jgi:predicted ester cyclase